MEQLPSLREPPLSPPPPPPPPLIVQGFNNPSLDDVLNRKTQPPLCLYSFYTYLRDFEFAHFQLDFWLDVISHENLCRLYCKDVIKDSLRQSLLSEGSTAVEELFTASTSNAANIESGENASAKIEKLNLARMSLRDVNYELRYSYFSSGNRIPVVEPGVVPDPPPPNSKSKRRATMPPTYHQHRGGLAGLLSKKKQDRLSTPFGLKEIKESSSSSPSPEPSPLGAEQQVRPRSRNVKYTRQDLRKSAERIHRRYIIPGSEREIAIPESLRYQIVQAIETDQRDDPEIFEAAKRYVFGWLEAGPYERFLKERLKHNITRRQRVMRFALGLFIAWIGLTLVIALILLNLPRVVRLWGLIPLWVAVMNLLASAYQFSPFLALIRRAETTNWRFSRLKDPQVIRVHLKMALKITLFATLLSFLIMGFLMIPLVESFP